MSCPLLYRFRTIDRLPEPPSPDAVRGTVVHKVLEDLFDLPAGDRTPAQAADLVQPAWEQVLEAEPQVAEMFGERGPEIGSWLASCQSRWAATSRSRTRPGSSRPSGSRTSRRCSRPGCCCAATSTGSTSRPPARSGSSTTRPARRRGEAFEAKALFQMKFYALVHVAPPGRGPAGCSS